MRLIPLDSFGVYGLYLFDKENGTITFQNVSNDTERRKYNFYGYASKVKAINGLQHCVAVFFESEKLFLQINQQRWNLFDPTIKLKLNRYGLFNSFKVFYGDKIQFECKYWSGYINPLFLIKKMDYIPGTTHDGFFSYIAINLGDKEKAGQIADFIDAWIKKFDAGYFK